MKIKFHEKKVLECSKFEYYSPAWVSAARQTFAGTEPAQGPRKVWIWRVWAGGFFLNIIIEGSTKLDPINLFKLIKNIEKTLGRKKSARNAPRKIDIDILDYVELN